jgi:hypothetical protein
MLLALEAATIGVTAWPLIFWTYPPFETHNLCPGIFLFSKAKLSMLAAIDLATKKTVIHQIYYG